MVMDLADDGRRYNFQYFQSTASMCLTIDCFPWFEGVITNPPPACGASKIRIYSKKKKKFKSEKKSWIGLAKAFALTSSQ